MGSLKSCQDGSSSSTDSSASRSTAATMDSQASRQRDYDAVVSKQKPALPPAQLYSYEPAHTTKPPRPRSSTSTYASTTHSVDLPQQEEECHRQQYSVTERAEFYPLDAIPSTPSSFAPLFPSSRRLLIRHDDATVDGNMNLRVDTPVHLRDGSQRDIILFHLRMYDLLTRKFSFRRYCRDSGREVCHSARKEVVSAQDRRPQSRPSWSTVFGRRPGSSSGMSALGDLKRQDSDFSFHEDLDKVSDERPILGDTILLEFSNYAHVELRRRGGPTKKYEFEYWSTKYQWRREMRKEGDLQEVSYFLVEVRGGKTIAHLVPDTLAPLEVEEEERKGGWVPPSSMWISDPEVYRTMPDVADVIVATGIVALVDDCIRRRWHPERRPSWILPAQHSLAKSLERMGPRHLISQVLQRRGSA
ncbi:hypothetical protein N7541_000770 [Penicillium brevicompactum]|uniref:Uncharacterized protein n=1 Tax=Penicillium brevicompactum TaxID=5074 RepID=A0A9W9RXE4_PENBR|nr:hypothetical protein N7541_000770 [Penicillium brevicompactum]